MICETVFQPVIKLIQLVISIVEHVLEQVCQVIQQLVDTIVKLLEWICKSVVYTLCSAICNVICGICSFFCWIFRCNCHCENLCHNICNAVTRVVCAWTVLVKTLLQLVVTLICDYILKAIIALLNVIEAVVTMVLTWVCTLIDFGINAFLCWTHLGDMADSTDPRRFRVAPKIVPNSQGHSDWFVYVNNPVGSQPDQNVSGYILSDEGRPLVASVAMGGAIAYYEVETREDLITGVLRRDGGNLVPGTPFLYYPHKVIEIASHLFADIFATSPTDDGRGTDFHQNLYTYNPNVQDWLAQDMNLTMNNYNAWPAKYATPGDPEYYGDGSLPDMGMRVDTDATCSHPTNTFLHLLNGEIQFTPGSSEVAENMSCNAAEAFTFDDQNFLLANKEDGSAVTTYLVSNYSVDDTHTGCNVWLGYTVVTFRNSGALQFVNNRVLPFIADTNRMMASIVENMSGHNQDIVQVAETYLHECGHQCGLLHNGGSPDCENDTTLHIAMLMNPVGSVRRAYTRFEWCMIRRSAYITSDALTPFTQAPELPDSGSAPGGLK